MIKKRGDMSRETEKDKGISYGRSDNGMLYVRKEGIECGVVEVQCCEAGNEGGMWHGKNKCAQQ